MDSDREQLKQKARELLSGGFFNDLVSFGSSFTTAIYWYDLSKPAAERILNSGSIFFLDLGEGVIGITAAHVYDKYEQDLRDNDQIQCQVKELRYFPCDRLITKSSPPDLDIATFKLNTDELPYVCQEPFRPRRWPPKKPIPGDPALGFGFPGHQREESEKSILWVFLAALGEATYTGFQFAPEYLVKYPNESRTLDFRGCSGGPILSLSPEDPTNLAVATITGVITDWNEAEALMGALAENIRPDGNLGP